MDHDRRFIEETFPVKEVSVESAKEKNIRHGHISTLHIWWARRPLASSRATAYAALIPAPEDEKEREQKKKFIVEFSKWENSLNPVLIERARKEILAANGGKPPRVLDPFAGGGAIPLEALRLGCEVYASDYNPVAVLIEKCTLEYPQKYGKPGEVLREEIGESGQREKRKVRVENKLLEDVKRWGQWVLEEAKKEIGKFYPEEEDGSIPVSYIWARTIPCQNPSCGAEIPLMRQFWLAKKDKKKVALFPYAESVGQASRLSFRIIGDGYEEMPNDFDPSKGTVSRAVATCLVCGSVVDAKTTRRLFQEEKAGQRMVAVVLHKPGVMGKRYRIATEEDMVAFRAAQEYLKEKREKLMAAWGMDPVPDEPLTRVPVTFGVINVWVYGMNTWGSLFNARQKLALITFVEKVRQTHQRMLEEGYEEEYAKAVVSYLAITTNNFAEKSNVLNRWVDNVEAIAGCYRMQALPMAWTYAEGNPLQSSVSWGRLSEYKTKPLYEWVKTYSEKPISVSQFSATSFPHPRNFFDAVFTDPPYYDNVPYSYLSDFFYIWLKRTLGSVHPELFSTPLTPKQNEIVAYSNGPGGWQDGKAFFEEMLKKSFQEIHRVLKPNGIAVIVYAHKSTSGWETLINSLLDSGLIMTGAWPINTEMLTRARAKESATLASSIYIVARKIKRDPTGFYTDVQEELKDHLNRKLDQLWGEGISGADFFIAAIGSAIEVFGKYEKVMDYEGNVIRADRLLLDVQKIATDYAVRQILQDGFSGEISDLTRFYVLWRWEYGEAKVHFDDARKLAMSCNLDVSKEWGKAGFIKKEKEFIRVLGPQNRKLEDLKDPRELIDILHTVLLHWEKGKREEMMELLQKSGYGKHELFYRVAQAISETLPNESKEKKLLDGFLAGGSRLREEITAADSAQIEMEI